MVKVASMRLAAVLLAVVFALAGPAAAQEGRGGAPAVGEWIELPYRALRSTDAPRIGARLVSWDDLYRYLGRADLADAYLERKASRANYQRLGALIGIAGMATTAVGEALIIADTCHPYAVNATVCPQRLNPGVPVAVAGVGVMGVAALIGLIAFAIDPQPLPELEIRHLISDYNRATNGPGVGSRLWSLTPVAVRGGGGLGFSLAL